MPRSQICFEIELQRRVFGSPFCDDFRDDELGRSGLKADMRGNAGQGWNSATFGPSRQLDGMLSSGVGQVFSVSE